MVNMRQTISRWAVVALMAHAGAACAAEAQVFGVTGTGTLHLDPVTLGLDALRIEAFPAAGDATVTSIRDSDSVFVDLKVDAPLVSLSYNTDNRQLTGASSSGGLTLVSKPIRDFSSGGSITLTDFSVDLQSRTVYANVVGGNGVNAVSHVALWGYAPAGSAPKIDDLGVTTLSGLFFVSEGRDVFQKSLGIVPRGTLDMLTEVGNYTISVSSVPEPSVYAMAGLGLAGLVLVRRRRG